jgi:hypothetical protein
MSLTLFTVFLLVTFYRDSMILATMALLTSIIVRGLKRTSISAPVWISGLSNWVLLNRFGQIFILHNLYPKVRMDFTFSYIYSANVQYQLQGFLLCGFRNTTVTPGCKINDPQETNTPPRPKTAQQPYQTPTVTVPVLVGKPLHTRTTLQRQSSKLYSPSPPDITLPTEPVGSGVAIYLGPRGEQSQWRPLVSN